jgi:hypothetical protein
MLMKLLKRIIVGNEVTIIPLITISSKDEFKDESKQILIFSQQ